jgi:hypothetical protein
MGNDGRAETIECITHVGEGDPEPLGDLTLRLDAQPRRDDLLAVDFGDGHGFLRVRSSPLWAGRGTSIRDGAAHAIQVGMSGSYRIEATQKIGLTLPNFVRWQILFRAL